MVAVKFTSYKKSRDRQNPMNQSQSATIIMAVQFWNYEEKLLFRAARTTLTRQLWLGNSELEKGNTEQDQNFSPGQCLTQVAYHSIIQTSLNAPQLWWQDERWGSRILWSYGEWMVWCGHTRTATTPTKMAIIYKHSGTNSFFFKLGDLTFGIILIILSVLISTRCTMI